MTLINCHSRLGLKAILLVSLSLFLIVAALGCARSQRASEQKPAPSSTSQAIPTSLPVRSGHVNDYVHAVDPGTRDRVEQALAELKNRSQIDFAIAIVKTTEGQPIFDYSLALARGWNVGAGGDGILLMIVIDDRQWRVQTSRKLERDLPNDKVREAGDEMKAPFGEGQYSEGVRRCVNALIKLLAAKRGFAPITVPEPLLRGSISGNYVSVTVSR